MTKPASARQLLPTQVFEMVGLLFASENERLINDPSADPLAFRAAVMRHKDAARAQYEYWVRLHDSEEYPIANDQGW